MLPCSLPLCDAADLKCGFLQAVGMMVFSMVIWMSLGHKLSHR